MYWYSPVLTWIVLATIPLYAGLSLLITPMLRERAEREVRSRRGEPGLPGRGGDRCRDAQGDGGRAAHAAALGGAARRLCARGFSCCRTWITGPARRSGLINKLSIAATLWFGARLVIDGQLSVGELVAFNMLAGRVEFARAAPRPALAGFPADAHLRRAPGRHPRCNARAGGRTRPRLAAGDQGPRDASSMSASAIAPTARACSMMSRSMSRRARSSAWSARRVRARAPSPNSSSGSTCPRAGA